MQTLKWFSEAGLTVEWNLLYGFPGEDPAEYAALAELLPSLYHLTPPRGCGRVRSDRFSPYFTHPEKYGITNLRPGAAFDYVFPFPRNALARLAYYFDFDYADGRRVNDYVGPLLERIVTWRELAGNVTLRMFDRGDGVLLIHDTRPDAAAFQQRLTGSGPRRISSLRHRANAGENPRLRRPVQSHSNRRQPPCVGCSRLDRCTDHACIGRSLSKPHPTHKGRGILSKCGDRLPLYRRTIGSCSSQATSTPPGGAVVKGDSARLASSDGSGVSDCPGGSSKGRRIAAGCAIKMVGIQSAGILTSRTRLPGGTCGAASCPIASGLRRSSPATPRTRRTPADDCRRRPAHLPRTAIA